MTIRIFLYPAGINREIIEHSWGHEPESGYYGHTGIDIAAEKGAPIYAAQSGEVILSGWYYGYGYCIVIRHENGLTTLYGHCDEIYVSEGEYVTRGQQIGEAGSTGYADSCKLHFEVRSTDDVSIDPELFSYEYLTS